MSYEQEILGCTWYMVHFPDHSTFLHFNGHFPGEPGLAGVY